MIGLNFSIFHVVTGNLALSSYKHVHGRSDVHNAGHTGYSIFFSSEKSGKPH